MSCRNTLLRLALWIILLVWSSGNSNCGSIGCPHVMAFSSGRRRQVPTKTSSSSSSSLMHHAAIVGEKYSRRFTSGSTTRLATIPSHPTKKYPLYPSLSNTHSVFKRLRQYCSPSHHRLYDNDHLSDWDGDDLRWLSKWKRRVRRATLVSERRPVRDTIVAVNILLYSYQVVNTVRWIVHRYPQFWPSRAATIISDALMGSTVPGPLTRNLWFSASTGRIQPHRYLTAGFLHGNIWHLVLNMDAMRRVPAWSETAHGGLFLTAYAVAVVAGNVGHACLAPSATASCLGSSGGICGLYGLVYSSLIKMGNDRAAWIVLRGMARLIMAGFFLSNVSNASHVAGFVSGMIVGIVLGPSYRRSYSARRKNSLAADLHSREYRAAMGFGVEPTWKGKIPVSVPWVVALLFGLSSDARIRKAPELVLRALLKPMELIT